MHLSIGQTAALLGVSVSTLRRWEREGFLLPAFRTCGGHRRFALATVESLFLEHRQETPEKNRVIAYARVSSHDQKRDLETQKERLAADVIELMTVFSSRLYGKRSHSNRKKAAAA